MTWRGCLLLMCVCRAAAAQIPLVTPGDVLDPSRTIAHAVTVGSFHQPLPEQYIWTADDAAVATGEPQLSRLKQNDWKVAPHWFQRDFELAAVPRAATLYLAGPRLAKVLINGAALPEMRYTEANRMGFRTMSADVRRLLRVGVNRITIEAVRGYGSHHHTNALDTAWLNSGEVLVAKIVPALPGVDAPPLVISDEAWQSAVGDKATSLNGWKPVVTLGRIESSIDFFQWSADSGLFDWPGYLGEAPYMANYLLAPVSSRPTEKGLLVDFGRELNGRIYLQAGTSAVTANLRMGESLGELNNAPYLGEIKLQAPASGIARGPKTGFRYAYVDAPPDTKILAEGIYYPAAQIGTFESSDPQLNRIFATAVYTAHLSMQDSILDGIKRDRGRWIGDDEVINRVVADVYGDTRLIKQGLEDAIGPAPVTGHVNGLPGYSAWWVVAEFNYISWSNDLDQLRSVTPRMLQLLALMKRELDDRNIYVAASGAKPFVDWSPGFSSDSPEARRAIQFEYLAAFQAAAQLLHASGREPEARVLWRLAASMSEAAYKFLQLPDETFGDRWQTNAMAADSLVVMDGRANVPWTPFARTLHPQSGDVITPYYGDYLLEAMSNLKHESEALDWIKTYWGGMLDQGATSFWEAWDPAWAGDDPHAKLQADDKTGYNASLAHGWSSGPADWLLRHVLGVSDPEPAHNTVSIQPSLAGLKWAKGTIATRLGPVTVEISERRAVVVLPPGMECDLTVPGAGWSGDQSGGQSGGLAKDPVSTPVISTVHLQRPGRYEFVRK